MAATGGDMVGNDGLLTYEEVSPVPLALVAAAGALTACAALAWVVSRALRQLGGITFHVETGYDKLDDGYWVRSP